jgi:hypothetical protein
MKNMKSKDHVPVDKGQKPLCRKITRRQFHGFAGTLLAIGVTASVITKLKQKQEPDKSSDQSGRFTLPPHPSHNPGFRGYLAQDRTLILATQNGDDFIGYSINGNGRFIWQLCDGQRPMDNIAQQYNEVTTRSKTEAIEFLQKLTDLGVVVSGGYITPTGNFPIPNAGECYHVRT